MTEKLSVHVAGKKISKGTIEFSTDTFTREHIGRPEEEGRDAEDNTAGLVTRAVGSVKPNGDFGCKDRVAAVGGDNIFEPNSGGEDARIKEEG